MLIPVGINKDRRSHRNAQADAIAITLADSKRRFNRQFFLRVDVLKSYGYLRCEGFNVRHFFLPPRKNDSPYISKLKNSIMAITKTKRSNKINI